MMGELTFHSFASYQVLILDLKIYNDSAEPEVLAVDGGYLDVLLAV